ncbi:MAG: phosphoribosylglycinamide formyltransferase [Candidatus Coatesbacteria bacterium]|nr:MAG: phosphoribosylglycinamide formyltransferase [Candidatus Coatesbacteria bacterium]
MSSDDPKTLNIGVLASGGGSNLQSIIDACETGEIPGRVVVVISNNSSAKALERAGRHGIDAVHLSNYHYPDDEELDQAIVEVLRNGGVELVCLAGYMKKRGPRLIKAFPNRILNIHPALLPRYGGKGMYGVRVHEAVLAAGDKVSGVSVHLVDELYDHGPIVAQREVPVLPDDTPETLAARVLKVEHEIYPEVIAGVARGDINLDDIVEKSRNQD